MDTVFDQLYELKIEETAIQQLQVYVKQEAFDTEAMDIDLQNDDQRECSMISNAMVPRKSRQSLWTHQWCIWWFTFIMGLSPDIFCQSMGYEFINL